MNAIEVAQRYDSALDCHDVTAELQAPMDKAQSPELEDRGKN
jgi:hypothetical protein